MPVASVLDLLEVCQANRILDAAQLEAIAGIAPPPSDPDALARELVQRGWLTAWQVNRIFHGRAEGLLLGSYVLLEELGEGGMGMVYKARNWKLGRIVALKVIRKGQLDTDLAIRRFRREMRAAAQLSHPNIVHALDADEVAGMHFFVMEYVEGRDLGRVVKERGLLTVAEACEYTRQAALGLQHGFERGLVHRDIKPANLLLTSMPLANAVGPVNCIKLLDMGIARMQRTADENASTLTQAGTIMGTPDFIAPEQARDSRSADIRSDLYSLGCTLYFLLSGQVPFPGGNVTEKLLKHHMDTPTPLDQLLPGVPPAVTQLVQRLMARRPEERYQTPAELVAAIDQLAGQAATMVPAAPVVPARPQNPFGDLWGGATEVMPPERTRKRRPHGFLLAWASAAATLLLAGLLVMLLVAGGRKQDIETTGKDQVPPEREPIGNAADGPRKVGDAWLNEVAALRAEAQVQAVVAKLKELNPGFDGKETHKIEGGVVTELSFLCDSVTDISPVQALAGLKTLRCWGSAAGMGKLADLSPLKGLQLTSLECGNSQVADLSPLTGMPLTALGCHTTRLKDLSSLKGMKLTSLNCGNTYVSDLALLKDMKLTYLGVDSTKVSDLSPLKGMQLRTFNCSYTQVADLAPLSGMPLTEFYCTSTKVADLKPLEGMPLGQLQFQTTKVADLSPLKGMKLTLLNCADTKVLDLSPLKGMPLMFLNCGGTKVSDLSPLKHAKLTELYIEATKVSDLSSLKSMPLTSLVCAGTPVSDLSPLTGMPLTSLNCINTEVWNLSPLKDMTLTSLACGRTKVSDLSPLKGMKLTNLGCDSCQVSDLSPLRGMPLVSLNCDVTLVSDLSPLKGMPLTFLHCAQTKVTDLSPLKGMPITQLFCDFKLERDLPILRSLSMLKTINNQPAGEFWKQVEAKKP